MSLFGCDKGDKGELVFLGLACDFGSSGPKGCNLAPEVLQTLTRLSGESKTVIDISNGKELFSLDKFSDLGILKYREDQKSSNYIEGIQLISENLIKEKLLFSFGGDHLITYPIVKGALKKFDKIQCLQFDAHFDCNSISDETIPSHNNFVSYLLQETGLSKWVAVGQRGLGKNQDYPKKLKRCGLNNFTSELDKDIPLYITVDCDVLDLSEFQAVSFPRPGKGLRLTDILNSLKTLKKEGYNIVGIDICEYNPKMDTETYLYGRILAHFIAEVLSIIKPRGLN